MFLTRMLCSVAAAALAFTTGAWAVAGGRDVQSADDAVPSVTVTRIDGTNLIGRWLGSTDGNELEIREGQGRVLIPVDDLSRIVFTSASPKARGGAAMFHLADGGWLAGALIAGESEVIVAHTALGRSQRLPFNRLAGVRLVGGDEFPRADRLFREALGARLPGKDVLITRDTEDVKVVRGRLESLDAEQGMFALGDRSRKFRAERIYGVVFAAGIERDVNHPVTVRLIDGSVFSGRIVRGDASSIRIETSLRFEADVAVADVAMLLFHSDRLVYLSDLTPISERSDGLLHPPWPVRRDRSVADRPLSIRGRVFENGLGVHSRTELVYQIQGAYETFVATVGIDDAVGPRGSVVFQVLGDGRVYYDSGVLTGKDGPRDVKADVTGVDTLTLLVDYGDGLDLSDQADWGDARLLKPRSDR